VKNKTLYHLTNEVVTQHQGPTFLKA